MKSRGILMTTVMVEALLKGTKTETRRGRGLKKINESPNDWGITRIYLDGKSLFVVFKNIKTTELKKIKCPYGIIGDGLWVRETWREAERFDSFPSGLTLYKADFSEKELEIGKMLGAKWTLSLYMPREASRFDLEIVDITCERLQNITVKGAIAEGIEYIREGAYAFGYWECEGYINYLDENSLETPIESYRSLFNLINGEDSWDKNPWVWVVKFKDITAKK